MILSVLVHLQTLEGKSRAVSLCSLFFGLNQCLMIYGYIQSISFFSVYNLFFFMILASVSYSEV